MNIRRKLRAHTEIHTGPLNDILFILLLFFLIAATLANPNVIKLSQPKSKGDNDTRVKQTVVVSIAPDKATPNTYNYYVGTNRVQVDTAIRELLRPLLEKEDSTNRTVVINADKTVPIENVVAIMRVARDMGARAVLAVDKSGQ